MVQERTGYKLQRKRVMPRIRSVKRRIKGFVIYFTRKERNQFGVGEKRLSWRNVASLSPFIRDVVSLISSAKQSASGRYTSMHMHTPAQDARARKAKKAKASNIKSSGPDNTDKPRKTTLNGRKPETESTNVYTLFCKPLLITNFKIRLPSQKRYEVRIRAKRPRRRVLSKG